jgi:NAD(P)H-flavin reductase
MPEVSVDPSQAGAGRTPGAAAPSALPASFRVARVTRNTGDTFTLELVSVDGRPEFRFAPGQFNMLYAFGMGEVPISISGDPAKPGTLVHTVRAVGAVTRALCALKKGHIVGVRGPFGVPWPIAGAAGRDVVIVAGGIGLAPVRPILYTVLADRGRYGRVVLLYGARTPRELLYLGDLEQWRSRLDLEVEVTVDSADRSWRGNVGTVTKLIPRAPFDPGNATAFVCGPEVMMRFVGIELVGRGMAEEQIFVSMERNMKCAIGLCGHCQFGPFFVCKDGPVFALPQVRPFLTVREV